MLTQRFTVISSALALPGCALGKTLRVSAYVSTTVGLDLMPPFLNPYVIAGLPEALTSMLSDRIVRADTM